MDDDARDLRLRVRVLEEELLGLRLALHRTVAALLTVGMLAGLLLRVYTDDFEDEPLRLRTVNAWYVALVDPGSEGDGFGVVLGIGFAGLLLVALVVVWLLAAQVVGGTDDRPWLRTWASGLTVVGSLVPAFFSLLSQTAETQETGAEPGWGGLVLLAAAIGAAVLLNRVGTQELGRAARRTPAGLSR